jgi:diguanylate cyclase (GGDEF)-like protein
VHWSGQQFVVILPDIEQDEAIQIAEKCRLAIEDNKITVASSFISTSASIGLSCSRDLSDGLGLMVEWAEQSMRQAKQAGRNRVHSK